MLPPLRVRGLSHGGPGSHCDWVPPRTNFKSRQRLRLPARGSSRTATCPHDSGSRLPARGSSGAATYPHGSGAVTCPRGSSSRLLAGGSSRAATCHMGSSTHLLTQGSSRAVTCPEDRLCRLQAIKQISPGDLTIMIFIGARARISSKALRDKGYSACLQDVQQVAH
jgi:hypothetical protein